MMRVLCLAWTLGIANTARDNDSLNPGPFDFYSLGHIGGSAEVSGNDAMTSLPLGRLRSVGTVEAGSAALVIDNNALTSLDIHSLADVHHLRILGEDELTSLGPDLRALERSDGTLEIAFSGIVDLDPLVKLTEIGGNWAAAESAESRG